MIREIKEGEPLWHEQASPSFPAQVSAWGTRDNTRFRFGRVNGTSQDDAEGELVRRG